MKMGVGSLHSGRSVKLRFTDKSLADADVAETYREICAKWA